MIKMAERPPCPECEKPMNFVVAKLTDDEKPDPEDVKSGWYCPECGEVTDEFESSKTEVCPECREEE